ncbi:trypsin-like peptidase domain-containing protein [Candidatus Kaiserbacteria bacterium]|nr:trypsin-like peptidase domain-containing protein [Candidatus Kaiserbacteria bacterium]USN88585.1 MAG: trypsin-like peptidase domain-containing protein [Candidatus Nomurabacteria bacterium]
MESGNIAKAIFVSSVTSVLVVFSALYIARVQIAQLISPAVSEPSSVSASGQDLIIDTIAAVNPAVVSVIITKDVPVYERYYESYDPWGVFGGFSIPRVRENGTEEREVGGGSGFIVSNDGLIVTNRHVVEDEAARYSVLLNDGTSYAVDVLARDPQLDIAILKINEPLQAALTYLTFGNSESLRLGEPVIAIGNALAEFRNSVSVGVVSGLSRSIMASDGMGHSEQLDEVIQTDAAINPGNSGGPLLNVAGEVIGVNVATSRGADNIGFALPAHVVRGVVESVKEYGEIVRPFLGVRYVKVTEQLATLNNLSVDYGVLVLRGESADELAVLPGSPADKAGIAENTIILEIDGEELRDMDLAAVLRQKKVGQTITLTILQDKEEKVVSVTLEKAL